MKWIDGLRSTCWVLGYVETPHQRGGESWQFCYTPQQSCPPATEGSVGADGCSDAVPSPLTVQQDT